MTAQVEIILQELDNVLAVPIPAVLSFDNQDHVAVKKRDGSFEWRDVTLGVSNDKVVSVTKGLDSGESVALNPVVLLSPKQKRDMSRPRPPTQPASSSR
jgi:HlyD family secretion protein